MYPQSPVAVSDLRFEIGAVGCLLCLVERQVPVICAFEMVEILILRDSAKVGLYGAGTVKFVNRCYRFKHCVLHYVHRKRFVLA